jgi:hypothetical protein
MEHLGVPYKVIEQHAVILTALSELK